MVYENAYHENDVIIFLFKNFLWLSCFVKKLRCKWTVEICYVIVKDKMMDNGGKHSYILQVSFFV